MNFFDKQTRWNIFAIPLALTVVMIPITFGAIYFSPEFTMEHIYASLITFGIVSVVLIIGFIAVRISNYEGSHSHENGEVKEN